MTDLIGAALTLLALASLARRLSLALACLGVHRSRIP